LWYLCISTFYGTLDTTFEEKRTSVPAGLQGLAQGKSLRDHPPGREDLGEPKSSTLTCPLRVQKNVGGFDVAVNDALRVSGIERVGQLDPRIQQIVQR